MLITIKPQQNLSFNKELYKFCKFIISTLHRQPINKENKDYLSDEDLPEKPITFLFLKRNWRAINIK